MHISVGAETLCACAAVQFYEQNLVEPKLWPFGQDLRKRFEQTKVSQTALPDTEYPLAVIVSLHWILSTNRNSKLHLKLPQGHGAWDMPSVEDNGTLHLIRSLLTAKR